jgi:hypothetical protein
MSKIGRNKPSCKFYKDSNRLKENKARRSRQHQKRIEKARAKSLRRAQVRITKAIFDPVPPI